MRKLYLFYYKLFVAGHCSRDHLKNYWIIRTAAIWQSVLIPCDLPANVTVVWRYCRAEFTGIELITTGGVIADNLKDRFQLEPSGLLISDVRPADAGWYVCRERRSGRRRVIRLSVPCKFVFLLFSFM